MPKFRIVSFLMNTCMLYLRHVKENYTMHLNCSKGINFNFKKSKNTEKKI